MREVAVLAQLDHERIVKFKGVTYDQLERTTIPTYMIMEIVQDGMLHGKIYGGGGITMNQLVRYAFQVAEGLAYCHEQGV